MASWAFMRPQMRSSRAIDWASVRMRSTMTGESE
jgi:hypothetical protein